MNKKFSKIILAATLLATSSLYAPTFAVDNIILSSSVVDMDQSQALLPTVQVNGEILIPLRAYLNLVGIDTITWQPVHTLGTYAKLTIEAPAAFSQAYHENLERALGGIYGNTIEALPVPLQGLMQQEKEEADLNPTSLQEKAIEVTINSEGNSTGFVFYNYANVDGTLYVMPTALRAFGLEGLDQISDNQALVSFRTQEQIKQSYKAFDTKFQEALTKLTPDEVITTWIRAQQSRSGSLQYALMCPKLQEKVLPEIKERGWVTGGSSPTLRGGKVVVEQTAATTDQVTYKIQLESMLQGKVYEKLEQVVTVSKINNRWCISNVSGADGYYNYENLSK